MKIPTPGARWLVMLAAPAEAGAVLRAAGNTASEPRVWTPVRLSPACDLVMTGVGKVNAGACLALLAGKGYGAVLSAGIAGALPGSGLEIGRSVLATASAYADEGLLTPEGFKDCAAMGFPLGPFPPDGIAPDPGMADFLAPLTDRRGIIATVSTCSGTDALADEVVRRTGAVAEAMEGAAVAHVAARLGLPSAEVRVVSNTTGNRGVQRWDLGAALAGLARVLGPVVEGR